MSQSIKKQAKQALRDQRTHEPALALIEKASQYLREQLQADIDAASQADADHEELLHALVQWRYRSTASTDGTATATAGSASSMAQELLLNAAQVIGQRGQERDTGQERSMAAAVEAFNAIEGTALSERQGWAFMQTLKLVRAASTARNGRYNPDDYLDGAAYAALGAEAAAYVHACQESPAA